SVRFVVEQSIDAILEGREIGVSREEFQRTVAAPQPAPEAPPPAPAPAQPPPPPLNQRAVAAGYEGVMVGSGEVQHAAKLVLVARFARIHIAGEARLTTAMTISGDGAQARLSTRSVSLSAAGRLLALGEFSVLAGLGIGLDMTTVEPTVTTPD